MTRINKALDLNKLFNDQAKGRMLRKHIRYPVYTSLKYDGNYVVVVKETSRTATFYTSGGHIYTHKEPTIFHNEKIMPAVYIAERIAGEGLLGDRVRCNLIGPRGRQVSIGHTYKVHDILDIQEYQAGISKYPFQERLESLCVQSGLSSTDLVQNKIAFNLTQAEEHLEEAKKLGFEGIMMKSPDWIWEHHKTRRTVEMAKYKKRPTADLKVVGVTEGEGKYIGMIGSLVLRDSKGREVSVGSGMDDADRSRGADYWMDKVVEIEYEQILDTYIQPTYLHMRWDKTVEEID